MTNDEKSLPHTATAGGTPDLPPGLIYTSDAEPGITRHRRGKNFCYRRGDGSLVRGDGELQRIRMLAIPPAYRQVWICALPHGHLQATGRDARGRKQYRYHALWRSERDSSKFDRLQDFARALPRIRRRVEQDLRQPCHCRTQLLATVVRLLDTTFGRIGNDEYARRNGSYGLTTLRDHHARLRGNELHLVFQGKSGVEQHLRVEDARLARVVRRCQHLPGQSLFRYQDEAGAVRGIGSADVNDYLHAIASEHLSAKDFRTWHASALALRTTVQALRQADGAFTLKQMLGVVARALGNTAAVCRKAYIHPEVLAFAALAGADAQRAMQTLDRLSKMRAPAGGRGLLAQERQLLAFLQDCAMQKKRGKAMAGID